MADAVDVEGLAADRYHPVDHETDRRVEPAPAAAGQGHVGRDRSVGRQMAVAQAGLLVRVADITRLAGRRLSRLAPLGLLEDTRDPSGKRRSIGLYVRSVSTGHATLGAFGEACPQGAADRGGAVGGGAQLEAKPTIGRSLPWTRAGLGLPGVARSLSRSRTGFGRRRIASHVSCARAVSP